MLWFEQLEPSEKLVEKYINQTSSNNEIKPPKISTNNTLKEFVLLHGVELLAQLRVRRRLE